ncbi:MAG TPA: dephospho-CoA kinase [Gaiellaceae bacterium]|nr:dephospho-CoA kinase [Gaiellaceae bacterium]
MSPPIAVAITGGIGAGKSEALDAFRRHGAATVSSDEIVHRLLREDEDVRGQLIERFGRGILDDIGQIDRGAIAERVFGNREQLEWLERLLHPRVTQEYLDWREQLGRLPNPPQVAVTEVPLLYEVGGEKRFDKVVLITAPLEVRAERSEVDAEPREARLISDAEKAKRADFVYVNDGTLEELDQFVAGVMQALTR